MHPELGVPGAQHVQCLLALTSNEVAVVIVVVRLSPTHAVELCAEFGEIACSIYSAAVDNAFGLVFDIEVFAVPHIDGNVVFLVTAVHLVSRRARQHLVTNLPQKAPVSRVRIPELKGDTAACRTSLAKLRFDVALVNVEFHGVSLPVADPEPTRLYRVPMRSGNPLCQ